MEIQSLTVAQIKGIVDREELSEEVLEAMAQDSRSAVRQLYNTYQKRKAAWQQELERLTEMHRFEQDLLARGYQFIAGTDEVGRGPLAGPVVAAAVILPQNCFIPGLNDSKKVAPAKREELAVVIKEKAVAWEIAAANVEEIDRINILQASLQAMNRAVTGLTTRADFLLVDAVTVPGIKIPQLPIIKGDAKSASIAAASILAKVYRDNLMTALAKLYPEYGFEQHKGYGSAEHIRALREHGPCPIHRRSFLSFLEQ